MICQRQCPQLNRANKRQRKTQIDKLSRGSTVKGVTYSQKSILMTKNSFNAC